MICNRAAAAGKQEILRRPAVACENLKSLAYVAGTLESKIRRNGRTRLRVDWPTHERQATGLLGEDRKLVRRSIVASDGVVRKAHVEAFRYPGTTTRMRRRKNARRRDVGIRRSPRDALVVAEHDPWNSWNRRTGGVHVRRLQIDEIPNAGNRQIQMRIVGEQRAAIGGQCSTGGPRVASDPMLKWGRRNRAGSRRFVWRRAIEHTGGRNVVAPVG